MTAAVVSIVLLLVGLPLLAFWLGGRRSWGRLRPGAEPDLYRELVRRHGLGPTEAAQVEGAATWGRELSDPRLRAAVVDWASSTREAVRAARRRHPRRRRVWLLVWLVVVVVAVVGSARRVVEDGWAAALSPLAGAAVWWVLLAVPAWRALTGPRRAIELNDGPPRA